ncbi:heat shock protein 70 family, partial [Jimgerdemannia flammicorona]
MVKHYHSRLLPLLACLLAVLLYGATTASAAVMSIDYGTEWFKVGLIKPGVPLDVALNRDSKRKTQSVITIRGEERFYGSDAGTRYPQNTYYNLKNLLGRLYDDKHCQEYRHRFVNNMIKDSVRGTAVFQHNETAFFTVEELIGFQFAHAKEQAEATAQELVKDVVITIPPYFNQFERQAVLDAAELAGLKVLSLMHDETAVALNYAMNRKFTTEPLNHIFFDMGAGSTVASLVSFSNVVVKEGKRNKTVPQIEVLAVGYDRTLGGYEFDLRLQNYLGKAFEAQKKGQLKQSVFESDKAMAKLLKEASRVKQILKLDFKTKVTRAELENLSQDLLDRIRGPIDTVLSTANKKV